VACKGRVPLAKKWLALCLRVQGLSVAAIARRLRVSDVTIRKYLSAAKVQSDDTLGWEGGSDGQKDPCKRAFEAPSNTHFNPPVDSADHLRAHKPGRPAKIDTDAELHAFIVARIDTTTFTELERQVAEAFPPDRRVSKTTIHAWWQRQPNRSA
jgi:hypothetical protein